MRTVKAIPTSRQRRVHPVVILGTIISLIFASFGIFPANAQTSKGATFRGRVVHAESGRPLANANVFIARSMMGASTNMQGGFTIEDIPPGAHRLYVSVLGFEDAVRDTVVRPGRTYHFHIRLTPQIQQLPPIRIAVEDDPVWRERLRRFKRLFIGQTANARRCTLLNPHVLRFEKSSFGSFVAEARKPLRIRNEALGYHLEYHLQNFQYDGTTVRYHGEPFFHPLEARSDSQHQQWRSNRRRAYLGSYPHFMQLLVQGSYEDSRFDAYLQPDPTEGLRTNVRVTLDPDMILEESDKQGQHKLQFAGFVQVVYRGEKEHPLYLEWAEGLDRRRRPNQTSWLELSNGPAYLDRRGETLDPYSIRLYGYFAFTRVGDILPKEYHPDSTRASAAAMR